jgi:uncharacterized protein with FMN-binding domain
MENKLKKYVASVFMVGIFGIYATYQYIPRGIQIQAVPNTTAPVSPTTKSSDSLPIAQSTPGTAPNRDTAATIPKLHTTPKPTSVYKDGTYIGTSVDAYYGNIQVQVAINGGVITNVSTLQSPDNRRQSVSINNHALPVLQSEVISVQNADINAVSGATYTSAAYKQSLAAAISKAKA